MLALGAPFALAVVLLDLTAHAQAPPPAVSVTRGADKHLAYSTDAAGNRVVDFSHAGYGGGGVALPDVPVRLIVGPGGGRDRQRIQAAVDIVSAIPLDGNGFRGTVLLERGTYTIDTDLQIRASGVVLRGSGEGEDGTVLVAAGTSRRSLVTMAGRGDRQEETGSRREIADAYVPAGALSFTVGDASPFTVGDRIVVRRPSTAEWIAALGMNLFQGWRPENRLHWQPGSRDIDWDRVVTAVQGNRITVDAPLTTAVDRQFGGGLVFRYAFPGRISRWASGVLYDNVIVRGNAIRLTNRGIADQGAGWAAANSVLWNSEATDIEVQSPPGATDQAYGCKGLVTGDGTVWDPRTMPYRDFYRGTPVEPRSLYLAQLADRLGQAAVEAVEPRPVSMAMTDAPRLSEADVASFVAREQSLESAAPGPPLRVENGVFTIGGQRAWTARTGYSWFHGQMPRTIAKSFGPAITRFAPGRTGLGATDDLEEVASGMAPRSAFYQHYGLWYDRRRVDHNYYGSPEQRTGDAWAPFMELPWARSGRGKAWDGLTRFDLTRFNSWYFERMKGFADIATPEELDALKAKLGVAATDQRDFLNGPEFQKLFDGLWASSKPMRYRGWREYRDRFPGLVLLWNGDEYPDVTRAVEAAIPPAARTQMRLADVVRTHHDTSWCVARPGDAYLVYAVSGDSIEIDLARDPVSFTVSWLDISTGALQKVGERLTGGRLVTLAPPAGGRGRPWVAWLARKK